MSANIERSDYMEFEVFAQVCDLHPEFLNQLVAIGLLEPLTDAEGNRWFERSQVSAVGRIIRLRSGLRLSYSAITVVAPLLDRIDELEQEVRRLEARVDPAQRTRRSTTKENNHGE